MEESHQILVFETRLDLGSHSPLAYDINKLSRISKELWKQNDSHLCL